MAGQRRRDRPDPVQAGNRWRIRACGKGVTALLYARLVEQDRAICDLAVAALFPDLAAGLCTRAGTSGQWTRCSYAAPAFRLT